MAGAKPAETPEPPYYAVIFTSQRTEGDAGYGEMAERMVALAAEQAGYLGIETVRDETGSGITISYWESEEAIARWRAHAEHLEAQRRGASEWYSRYVVRVARVERAYGS